MWSQLIYKIIQKTVCWICTVIKTACWIIKNLYKNKIMSPEGRATHTAMLNKYESTQNILILITSKQYALTG